MTRRIVLGTGLAWLVALLAGAPAHADPDPPPPEFFADHRATFMERMEGGIAIFQAPPVIPRNDDAEYPYRTDSDFWYLTGFTEPGAVAVLRPGAPEGERFAMFVAPRDPAAETWTGRRAGVESVRERHRADLAWPVDSLVPVVSRWLEGTNRVVWDDSEDHPWSHPAIDSLLATWTASEEGRELVDADPITAEMRLVKSDREIEYLQRAIDLTTDAHRAAMAAMRPGMTERQVQALIEYVFRAGGSPRVGFGSIVGSGPNTTILHYVENDRTMEEGDLVVMDIGAEWNHYSADVTRTVPVSGSFTPEQRAVYEVVLAAQAAAIDAVRPGATMADVSLAAARVVTEGLVEIGLLEGTVVENLRSQAFRRFFMHGTSHWLGLDVHDAGSYQRSFEPGMVLTVEPGVYVAEGSEGVDPRWWNIGVRIEDDVLVVDNGREVLSDAAPREIDAIEALMSGSGLPEVVPE